MAERRAAQRLERMRPHLRLSQKDSNEPSGRLVLNVCDTQVEPTTFLDPQLCTIPSLIVFNGFRSLRRMIAPAPLRVTLLSKRQTLDNVTFSAKRTDLAVEDKMESYVFLVDLKQVMDAIRRMQLLSS